MKAWYLCNQKALVLHFMNVIRFAVVIINQIVAVFNFQFGVAEVITNQIVAVFNFQFEVAVVITNQNVMVLLSVWSCCFNN